MYPWRQKASQFVNIFSATDSVRRSSSLGLDLLTAFVMRSYNNIFRILRGERVTDGNSNRCGNVLCGVIESVVKGDHEEGPDKGFIPDAETPLFLQCPDEQQQNLQW